VANWLNEIQGKGLDSKNVDAIRQAMLNQYNPRFERAARQKKYYQGLLEKYGSAGYDVGNPIGSQGIRWDAAGAAGGGGPVQQPTGLQDPAAMAEDELAALEAQANARGRTLTPPDRGRNVPGGQRRRERR
jgi:hypothetical protein